LRHVLEVEDVDCLAANLTEDHVLGGDVADAGHHAALPALHDLGRLVLVVEAV
jgi:hypothetical protein